MKKLLGKERTWIEPRELQLLKREGLSSWTLRARDLGILPRPKAVELWRFFVTHGRDKHEPDPQFPRETPRGFEQLIYRALAEDLIGESKAASSTFSKETCGTSCLTLYRCQEFSGCIHKYYISREFQMGSSSCALMRALAWGWICVLLYGCGGGGGGSDATSTRPTMTVSSANIALSADTSASFAPSATVQIQLKNVPAEGYWYSYWVDGAVVANIQRSSSNDGFGLIITLVTPQFMGAGTYTDTIHVEVCVDQGCATPFSNSPVHIPVSYVVTGNQTPGASFSIPDSLFVEAPEDGSQTTATVSQSISALPPYGMYFGIAWNANGVVSTGQFASANGLNLNWSVNLKGKNLLSAGVYRDSLRFMMCFDEDCTKTSTDSPKYLPLTYSVMAEAGTDYTINEVTGQPAPSTATAVDMAYDSVSQRIYALYWYPNKGAIARINPITRAVEATLEFSGSPQRIHVSSDGQSAFVINWNPNIAYSSQITEIDLASMTVSSVTDLIGSGGEIIDVYSFSVAPGNSHRLAMNINQSGSRIAIYEAGQQIASWALSGPYSASESIAWAGSDSLLYHYNPYSDTLQGLELVGTNLQQTTSVADLTRGCRPSVSTCSSRQIVYSAGRIYSNSGVVYEVATNTIIGRMAWREYDTNEFYGPDMLTVATDGSRAYFFPTSGPRGIVSFDLATLRPIVEARIPSNFSASSVSQQNLLSWGTDGLAFLDNNGVVIAQGSFVSQVYNPNNDIGSSIQSAPDKTVITAVGSAAIQ